MSSLLYMEKSALPKQSALMVGKLGIEPIGGSHYNSSGRGYPRFLAFQ